MKQLLQILTVVSITTLFLSSCEKDETSDSNILETFDCISGDCMNVGSNGTYNSLSDCQSSCDVSNNTETFNCINGDCINVGNNGAYSSLSDCQINCGDSNNTETFDCINGDCINVGSNGTYSSFSDCQIVCDGSNLSPCNGMTTISWGGHTYQLVEIGSQCWFAENLRYSGNIQEVTSINWNYIWNTGNEQPAWGYYNDDSANDAVYGKLYNWYAVNTGILCPSGWHIPTDTEWTELTDYLGDIVVAGGKMKTTTGWDAPNTGASNSSGFSGLPGGYRYYFGNEFNIGSKGFWWSSTEYYADDAWYRTLSNNGANAYISKHYKEYGFSCRCIKD